MKRERALLSRTQARYNADFNNNLNKTIPRKTDDFVLLEVSTTEEKEKLMHQVSRYSRFLYVESLTVALQLGDLVEQVSVDRVARDPRPNEGEGIDTAT